MRRLPPKPRSRLRLLQRKQGRRRSQRLFRLPLRVRLPLLRQRHQQWQLNQLFRQERPVLSPRFVPQRFPGRALPQLRVRLRQHLPRLQPERYIRLLRLARCQVRRLRPLRRSQPRCRRKRLRS